MGKGKKVTAFKVGTLVPQSKLKVLKPNLKWLELTGQLLASAPASPPEGSPPPPRIS